MPPRNAKKKQTRLAFASSAAGPSQEANSNPNSRYSTLTFNNAKTGIISSKKPVKATPQAIAEKKQPESRQTEQNTSISKKLSNSATQDTSKNEPSDESTIPTSKRRKQHAPTAKPEVRTDQPQNTSALNTLKMSRSKKSQQTLQIPQKDPAVADGLNPSQPRRAPKRKARSSPIDLSDSDEPPVSNASKKATPAQQRGSSSSPLVLSEDEDDNEIVAPSTARKRRTRPVITHEQSDDSDEPVPSSPMKRLRRGPDTENTQIPQTPRHTSKQAKLDIEEDLEDLQDSVVKKTRTRGRNVESARDKRLKQLDVLRRRRAGLKEESEDEEQSGSDVEEIEDPGTGNSPSGEGLWKHHEENSDEESAIDPNEDLDRYEDDFVLEDGKDDLGVPTEEIPFEFTRHAYKQPKEYFRDVIGWMVQNKLNPAFPRSDAMYEMAFMKLEDEVKGRAGSQLISSVWTPAFVYALQARPHMDVSAYPTEDNHSCDACRRSGHPASADMKLYGKPYSLQTLEPLEDEDDSDSDSNGQSSKATDDGKERDRNGHVLPDENGHFYLGKQCKSRAQLAHTLTHWRYHLNEWVIDHLERMGLMVDDEILRRNNLSVKRRTRNANDVLDMMVTTGEVEKLWRDFHLNLKSAREKEVCCPAPSCSIVKTVDTDIVYHLISPSMVDSVSALLFPSIPCCFATQKATIDQHPPANCFPNKKRSFSLPFLHKALL
ncbi:unnamed protein product [Penicillium salamii]|uniref:DUF4211 domain-containing protein n=1 Tax=Penicillium salamii TaxID=1612424 RepID=A0A9W4NNL8_9EURO|nr:unnamed protein product [Penicillium salamii]CAG8363345.1 unnamed protein product [Penicillium salamii]CAG8370253.1 unnamed protein product [Penicillium salamii]CAG8389784.1 unnamed protein product [Penicillium salamii]